MNISQSKLFKWLNHAYSWWIIDVIIVVLLLVSFGLLYTSQHAWGAWGDDSPGYIYTAGQFIRGESLVVQDPLVQSALEQFGDEKLARFVTPTHHEIISPDGWIASKYPVGLAWLLALVVKISGSDLAMYIVVPWLAVITVVSTYMLAIVWLRVRRPWKRFIGLFAALSVGLSSLFANYAVAQPMRDIPGLAFSVLSFVALGIAVRFANRDRVTKDRVTKKSQWIIWIALGMSGALFGYAVNIRETCILFGILFLGVWWQNRTKFKWMSAVIFFCGFALTLSLTIWNSVQISQHQQAFRDRDNSSIAITSNFDHVQSLQFKNIYNNQGKFRPGVGGAVQYWEIINAFSNWIPFVFFAIIGLLSMWWKDRKLAWLITSWISLMFILFSMWINPYPRYILIILPAVAIASGYGLMESLRLMQNKFKFTNGLWIALVLLIFGSLYVPLQQSLADRTDVIADETLIFKSISKTDNATLQEVVDTIQNTAEQPPILLMLGQWKSGISETIMTHSDLRVIRFPRKSNELPPYNELVTFIDDINKTSDVYVWYDSTADETEQRYYSEADHSVLTTYSFSFEPTVELSRLNP